MLTSKESREFMGSILNNLNESEKVTPKHLKARKGTDKSKINEAPVSFMEPEYDSRASFYKKAKVDTGDSGKENKLYSYDTLVAEMKDGKPVVYGTYSQTTLRHIKEWLKQNGFKAENSKQIMADYGVKEESCKVNENEEKETPTCSVCGKELTDGQGDAGVCKNCIDKENKANESCKVNESQASDVYEEIKGEHRQGNVSDFEVLLAGMISDIAEDMGDDYSEWLGKVDVDRIIERAMEQDSIWKPLEDYLAEEIERKIEEIRGIPGEDFEESANVEGLKEEDTQDEYGTNPIDEFNGYSLYKSSQAADVDGQSFGKYLVKDSNGNGVRSFISQNDMKAKTLFRKQ